MRKIIPFIFLFALMASCERRPPLFLYDKEGTRPQVSLALNVDLAFSIQTEWWTEWTYGWDTEDIEMLGDTAIAEPEEFVLRQYFIGDSPENRHSQPLVSYIGRVARNLEFRFGYYDLLVCNYVDATDDKPILFDESTHDSVMVFANETMFPARYQSPKYTRAFKQPLELYAGYLKGQLISQNYDGFTYDSLTNTYSLNLSDTLYPVTYRYYTQVRFHNNRGRVEGVDGNANLSGMAMGVTLNSGISSKDAITVHYNTRFKKNCVIKATGEYVDIAGGRCITFGIPNQNSSRVSRAEDVRDKVRHYIDLNVIFNNGMDSTMVFDVTDQVRKKYRGGVITIDLDVDTIRLPSRPGGSGFDAVVKDYEEEEYEFEM